MLLEISSLEITDGKGQTVEAPACRLCMETAADYDRTVRRYLRGPGTKRPFQLCYSAPSHGGIDFLLRAHQNADAKQTVSGNNPGNRPVS